MYCSRCGSENGKNNKFCFNCGNKLYVDNKKDMSGNKETSLVLGIICICSCIFLNILCFIPGIISIVYAVKYKKESGKLGIGFGLSIGGMILSIVILILLSLLIWFIIDTGSNYNYIDPSIQNIENDYLGPLYSM